MPTLPLYNPAAAPDAWHEVIAPGGYEWWHFEAEDSTGAVEVVADFYDGEPDSALYRRAYARFRRQPTRVAPPVPREYPCVRFRVWEKVETVVECTGHFPPGTFQGSVLRPEITVGPNKMALGDDGVIQLSLAGKSIEYGLDASIEMTLSATSFDLPTVCQIATPDDSAAKHFRIEPDAQFEAAGTIRLTPPRGASRTLFLRGRGRCNHRFGLGPRAAIWDRTI